MELPRPWGAESARVGLGKGDKGKSIRNVRARDRKSVERWKVERGGLGKGGTVGRVKDRIRWIGKVSMVDSLRRSGVAGSEPTGRVACIFWRHRMAPGPSLLLPVMLAGGEAVMPDASPSST